MLLWWSYLNFEIKAEDSRNSVQVFVRAVRHIPWGKGLYMYAFRELRGLLAKEELADYAKLMVEKELRLHHPQLLVQ